MEGLIPKAWFPVFCLIRSAQSPPGVKTCLKSEYIEKEEDGLGQR